MVVFIKDFSATEIKVNKNSICFNYFRGEIKFGFPVFAFSVFRWL